MQKPVKLLSATSATVFMAILIPCQAAPVLPMKPGVWEIVVASEETPSADKKKSTTMSRICLQDENLRSAQQALPRQVFGAKCAVKDYKYAGDAATWTLACTTKNGSLSGPGSVTYQENDYSGTAQLTKKEGGMTIKVSQTFTAKRVADCP